MKDSINYILAILASAVKKGKKGREKGNEKSAEVSAENVKSTHRKKKPAHGNLKPYSFNIFVNLLFLAVNAAFIL